MKPLCDILGECFSSCIRLLLSGRGAAAADDEWDLEACEEKLRRDDRACASRRRFSYSRNSNIFEQIRKFVAIELSSMHPRHVYGIYVTCKSLVTF